MERPVGMTSDGGIFNLIAKEKLHILKYSVEIYFCIFDFPELFRQINICKI